MKIYVAGVILLVLLLVSVQPLHAQKKEKKDAGRRPPSGNTSYRSERKGKSAQRDYLYLYRTSARGLLQGNKCVEDYTERMGFRYIVMPQGQEGSLSDSEMRLHNFGVKFLLLLKNGPFWHYRLDKKIKYCREKTGDYVG